MKLPCSTLIAGVLLVGCMVQLPLAAEPKSPSSDLALTNVYDAFGVDKKGLVQDFGFSCVVNYKGKMILFDSGTDAKVFESNLKTLKIDLKKLI